MENLRKKIREFLSVVNVPKIAEDLDELLIIAQSSKDFDYLPRKKRIRMLTAVQQLKRLSKSIKKTYGKEPERS